MTAGDGVGGLRTKPRRIGHISICLIRLFNFETAVQGIFKLVEHLVLAGFFFKQDPGGTAKRLHVADVFGNQRDDFLGETEFSTEVRYRGIGHVDNLCYIGLVWCRSARSPWRGN